MIGSELKSTPPLLEVAFPAMTLHWGRESGGAIAAATTTSAPGMQSRDRVAIFGGSYGRYAALVGVPFTPDAFAAAIDYVGVSDNMAEALRARGVEVEYLVEQDEVHGFLNPDNQIDMYHAVERFLAQYLGGRV